MKHPFPRRAVALAATVLMLATAPGLSPNAAARESDAESSVAEGAAEYIRELSRTAIERLGDPEVSQDVRAARARKLLENSFAGRDLGRFVLGRYWRVAGPAQQDRFLELLREVALQRFLPTFQHLDPGQIQVERAVADPQAQGLVRVITRIDIPQRGPIRLAWRLRPTDTGSYKIVDIMAEGMSMAITLRSEYSSVIEHNGGRVAALLEKLERRLDDGMPSSSGQARD